jgi:uncharacterized protein (TIGR03083 family)
MVASWDVAHDVRPLDVRQLMHEERGVLISLLSSLTPEEWRAHAVGEWNVHDVALHLLGNDFGRLGPGFTGGYDIDYATMARVIEQENEGWVGATRRIPAVLLPELLRLSGQRLDEHLGDLDMEAPGLPVAWSGSGPSPMWLDVAREYTERWVHHQQVRDAVRRQGLKERKWVHPVFEAFTLSLPRAYESVRAAEGTEVCVVVTGPSGGAWSIKRDETRWRLVVGSGHADAEVHIPEDVAWRLFTRMMPPDAARSSIRRLGSAELTEAACTAVAIMTTSA